MAASSRSNTPSNTSIRMLPSSVFWQLTVLSLLPPRKRSQSSSCRPVSPARFTRLTITCSPQFPVSLLMPTTSSTTLVFMPKDTFIATMSRFIVRNLSNFYATHATTTLSTAPADLMELDSCTLATTMSKVSSSTTLIPRATTPPGRRMPLAKAASRRSAS